MATSSVAPINYHVLFFGLDFYYAKDILKKTWKAGLIDVLPVLEGGIRYVLKYLDKQMYGDDLKKHFTDKGVEPPFSSFSTGIGNELFINQYDFIRKTGTYKNLAGKERPISPYYRNLFSAPTLPPDFDRKLKEYERRFGKNADILHGYDEYESALLYGRERALASSALNSGHAVYMPQLDVQHYGAVRQMMYRQYEASKVREEHIFNESVLQKLYELGTICV